jgi:hypothetical protein
MGIATSAWPVLLPTVVTSLERPRARQEMAIARARERYEQVPRPIDEHLEGMTRGDRGCLGDVLTVIGALVTPILGIMASRGGLPLLFPLLGVGLAITGVVLQRKAQKHSSEERTRALKEGPLVLVWLVDPPEAVIEGTGEKVIRVIGVCTTRQGHEFDADYLARVGERLRERGREAPDGLGELFVNEFATGLRRVPASLGARDDTWAMRVIVYPKRLQGGVSSKRPAIPCIVDVERGFCEHV